MKKVFNAIVLSLVVFLTACGPDDSPAPVPGGGGNTNNDPEVLDQGIWKLENADMPSENLKSKYEYMEFSVDKEGYYKWKWVNKSGTETLYEGYVLTEDTDYTYSNGKPISSISVNVTSINGQSAPGGWVGIYTYDDNSRLLLNVEPNVPNWGEQPTAQFGIGSGESGMESVFPFTKQ